MRVVTFSVQVRAHLLTSGDFLSAMPESMLRLNPECIGLKQLPIKLAKSSFPVAIVTLKNRTLSPPVEPFLDSLRT
jgi:DNA-binding transcriptional LysR family regulator